MWRQRCCCRCMWLDQDWSSLPTPHVESHNVDTETHSVTLVTDDGSPIGCRKSAGVFDFKIVDKQTPCAEFAFDLAFTMLTPPPFSYLNEYFIGQVFPDFEFMPDGATHTLIAYIDRAFRYSEIHIMNGVAGEILYQPIIDATVPTSLAVPGSSVFLYAEQNGNHFIATYAGLGNFIVSLGTPQAGDWGRWATTTAGTDTRILGDTIWQQVGPLVTVGGQQTMFSSTQPDWTKGAPPVYFGWAYAFHAQSQVNTSLPGGDLRFTRWKQTIRLDRFCMTIT